MTPIEGTQTILVVSDDDDDATVRALKTGRNLRNPLRRCESGEDALNYLFRTGCYASMVDAPKPGIILLDLNMPGIEGRTLLAKIKGDPSLRSIPVIVMTNSDDKRNIDVCYEIGASTYILKPLNWLSFLDAMNRLKEYWFEITILPRTDP